MEGAASSLTGTYGRTDKFIGRGSFAPKNSRRCMQVFASCTREFDNDNKAWCSTKTDSQVSTAMHSKVPGTPNQTTTLNSPSTDGIRSVQPGPLKEKATYRGEK